MNTSFVHLHLHTSYSLLDGACRPEDVVQAAIDNEMPAVAITDHGVMYGAIEFYKAAKRRGIRPVIGCEVYVARGSRLAGKDAAADAAPPHHLVLLAETDQGYHNLVQLVSASFIEGFHLKPRIDREILASHCKGIIALSACENGEVAGHLLGGDFQAARRTGNEYAEILGKDNFFLEIQDHDTENERRVNASMLKLAAETGLGLVATNNVHYIRKEHAGAHAVLLCLQSQTVMSDPKRLRFPGEEFYFKSAREMEALFGWAPDAVARTREIAERCDVQIRFGDMHFPAFPVPGGRAAGSYLESLCFAGLKDRCGIAESGAAGNLAEREVLERARHELDIIVRTGYVNYYLLVRDFVQFAREKGIPVGLRGSGGSSLVAYAIGITDIDPLRYSLVFERFLNPERASPPDFDIDFCHERRAEVIKYLQDKYPGRVAHIASFGTFSGRTAIRDTARVLEVPHEKAEKLLHIEPDDPKVTLETALARNHALRMECDMDPACGRVIADAMVLEGLCRSAGTHGAGIVIGEKPLAELLPLAVDRDGLPITQYSMEHLAEIGLLKMDLLGLRTLTMVKEAMELASRPGRTAPVPDVVPPDDAATLDLLNCGNTIGVFQLESGGMRELLRRFGLERMEDLIAVLALYRPGAMHTLDDYIARKTGKVSPVAVHPLLHPVLKETFGVIVYDEQVMAAACVLAGYTPGQADLFRRAIGGKDPETAEAQRDKFVKGCMKKHRIPEETAVELFDKLSRSAEYASSKAHCVAYAVLAYRTAYLKANHPAEFMASLISSEMGETGKLQMCINEADAMGLRILPPDINRSDARFLPVDNGVRFGLCGIRNLGGAAVDAVLEEREAGGPYSGLTDFCIRVTGQIVHRKAIETLVLAGCFDSTGLHRARLFKGLDAAMACAAQARRDRQAGQVNLFDIIDRRANGRMAVRDEDVMPDCEPWHESLLLSHEKALLSFYISGHPLSEYAHVLERYHLSNVKALRESRDGSKAITGGIVSAIEMKTTHQGARMAVLTMDCLDGEIDVVVFPSVYSRFAGMLEHGAMLFACGEIRHEEPHHTPRLHAAELCPLSEIHTRLAERVSVHIPATRPADIEFAKVRDILHRHPGPVPVVICLEYPRGEKVFLGTDKGFSVMPDDNLLRELEQTVGESGVYVAVRDLAAIHP